MRYLTVLAASAALAACSSGKDEPAPAPTGTVEVTALGETDPVGTNNEDAADDAAIWRNAADPAASLILGTDKKAGLHVYGLDGKSRSFAPDGRLNNVDLATLPDGRVIVVASDRNDEAQALLRIYRLDTAAAKLEPLGTVPAGEGEAYGVCVWLAPDGLHAFSVLKGGTINEYRLDPAGRGFEAAIVRTRKLGTQTEGCIADPRDGTLYVGEEDVGIWRFGPSDSQGELVAKIDDNHLIPDVEGLALVPEGANGGILIASSQGDNAYALFALPGMAPAGRFKIAKGAFGSAEETDGIALVLGAFGPKYPGGLFVAQDGENGTKAQNFKLVSWQDVTKALIAR
jgi:3-phytase